MIDQVIGEYNIDTSYIVGTPTYDPLLENAGEAYPDGHVRIGPGAFSSTGVLANTIDHENFHERQLQEGRYYLGYQGGVLNEVEAFDHDLSLAYSSNPFGLSEDEIFFISQERDRRYRELNSSNQTRVNNGIYTIPNAETYPPVKYAHKDME
jgi:hypothetical protein